MTESTPRPQSDRELVVSRVVEAPKDLVYRAITELRHVAEWWGPFGFRNTIHEMSVAPGGTWRFTMHGPDGTDYPNLIRFESVVPADRLVFHHGTGTPGELEFDAAITLVPEGRGTRVTIRQTHESAARAAEIAKYAVEGGMQTLARLDGYTAAMRESASAAVLEGAAPGTEDADFVLLRAFDAPRDLLFRVLTDPEHLAHWFGPGGSGVRVVTSDLRPGGQLRYAMKAGPSEMFGRFVYREVSRPARYTHLVSFTNAAFEPVRHPASATWPLEVLAINTLTEVGTKTLFAGRSIAVHATPEERATFKGGHAGMRQGMKGAHDQLEAYLKTLVKS